MTVEAADAFHLNVPSLVVRDRRQQLYDSQVHLEGLIYFVNYSLTLQVQPRPGDLNPSWSLKG